MKVLIVGAGKLGIRLAKVMDAEQYDVTLVERNPKKAERINEQLDVLTIEGNGVDITFLNDINVKSYDLVVATTDNDETNIVVCDFAKKLGCKQTIARIRDLEYSNQMDFIQKTIGIDLIINPDLSTARMIAKYLLRDMTYYTGEFANGRVRIVDFNIKNNARFVGKKIVEISELQGVLITAVSRENDLLIPSGDTILQAHDIIYLLGTITTISDFTKQYKLTGTEKAIENIMIIGGGNIGMYLAQKLAKSKVNVKLIEENKARAHALTELLDHVLIIHGDGSDITLLEEEELESMQAIVTVTGLDELNLLVALIAKHHGVNKSIAKVSRDNYSKIINDLQIDAAINPLNISVGNILKFVRGDKVESISLLLGGEGEVSEIIASKDMHFINKPLSQVSFPKGILIGAIIHQGEVSIANGQSVIQENDRIIVFCHSSKIPQFKNTFMKKKGGVLREIWNR